MVVFKEILPNPTGKDTEGEWVKIVNTGNDSDSLSGWILSDASGKTFSFSKLKSEDQTILPSEEMILPHSVTRISLNNSNETLKLINNNGKLEDSIYYKGPISDDEIVFGNEFIPEQNSAQASIGNIGEHAFRGDSVFSDGIDLSPFLIAFIIAVVFGISMGLLSKKFIEEK